MSQRGVILPGATLGVMGGGQLGRMFVHAAQAMGYSTAVLDADPTSPAGLVSHLLIPTSYLDDKGLAELASVSAAVTTEFENVPAQALNTLAQHCAVSPSGAAVAVCQDRALEKAHFVACGVACAPHALIASPAHLAAVSDDLLPGILKTARLGYDGKGQVRVQSRAELAAAWHDLKQVDCVLEKRLPLAAEVSVIVARGRDGQVVHFPVQHNLHRDGILAVTSVPAPGVSAVVAEQAIQATHKVASSLDYVGVLCVEFFVLQDGRVVANEMAPRPHNSGHHTIDACNVSQFELQVRTMAGLPLVPPVLHSPCFMLNLLGDLWFPGGVAMQQEPDWAAVLALSGTHLHLYGKTQARPGRKMGHLTVTGATPEAAKVVALKAAAILGIDAFLICIQPEHAMHLLDPVTQTDAIQRAAQRLADGGLLALPTETVYGLGARADDDAAVARIFKAKGRPSDHPLIVHVANQAAALGFVSAFPPVAQRLTEAFWPGPLTVIVPRRPDMAFAAAGGHDTIGLRCPDHPVARALLDACGQWGILGVAAPSANRFGRISPTRAEHVLDEFKGQGHDDSLSAVWVLQGGACEVGIESTIVDCSRGRPVLLRPGRLTSADIEAVAGMPVQWSRPEAPDPSAPKASGTLASHYAPRAKLRLMSDEQLDSALDLLEPEFMAAAIRDPHHAPRIAVYSRSLWARRPFHRGVVHRSMPADAVTAAHDLFADLRDLDAQGVEVIWVEVPPADSRWDGVRDRLSRAAAS